MGLFRMQRGVRVLSTPAYMGKCIIHQKRDSKNEFNRIVSIVKKKVERIKNA